jgi:hypothetical protein
MFRVEVGLVETVTCVRGRTLSVVIDWRAGRRPGRASPSLVPHHVSLMLVGRAESLLEYTSYASKSTWKKPSVQASCLASRTLGV